MIILDTNIISEMMKSQPNIQVSHWLSQQQAAELYITAITIAEISYGINALSKGKRRQSLHTAFNIVVIEGFEYRILDFDERAAQLYGDLMAHRRAQGAPMSICDGQIAAIARLENYALATRNTKDFTDCNLTLINPFD